MLPNNNKGTLVKLLSLLKEEATIPGSLSSNSLLCFINSIARLLISKKQEEVMGGVNNNSHACLSPIPSAEGHHTAARLWGEPYLGLEIMRIVVSVLGVHLWLVQAFAHVAGIPVSEAGDWMTGYMPQAELTVPMTDEASEIFFHPSLVPTQQEF